MVTVFEMSRYEQRVFILTILTYRVWPLSHVHMHTNDTHTLYRVFAGSAALVMGEQCESGLIASSAGCWWQADAFTDGTLEHNTPKQNNWGVNCSARAAVQAR